MKKRQKRKCNSQHSATIFFIRSFEILQTKTRAQVILFEAEEKSGLNLFCLNEKSKKDMTTDFSITTILGFFHSFYLKKTLFSLLIQQSKSDNVWFSRNESVPDCRKEQRDSFRNVRSKLSFGPNFLTMSEFFEIFAWPLKSMAMKLLKTKHKLFYYIVIT